MTTFPGNDLPMLKLPQWFGGQIGVPGSDTPLGLRTAPQGLVYYVDPSHGDASDNNDGTDPNEPLSTIQQAITNNNATITWANTPPYDGVNYIVVSPGTYAEKIGACGHRPGVSLVQHPLHDGHGCADHRLWRDEQRYL